MRVFLQQRNGRGRHGLRRRHQPEPGVRPNVTSNGFNVTVKNNGIIYTNIVEKTVNLRLFNLGTTPGATFGISNAVMRIINPNFQGYVTLGASNYTGTVSSGVLNFVVNRVSGSLGSVTVQYATTNGSAVNGVDYIGSTNTLIWNSGDVSPRTVVSIPLSIPASSVRTSQFGVTLFNPTHNGAYQPGAHGDYFQRHVDHQQRQQQRVDPIQRAQLPRE